MPRVSLNLLPPEKKQALRSGFIMAFAQTMVFILFVVAAFVAGTFVSVRVMLKSNLDALVQQSTGGAADESDAVAADIRQINTFVKRVDGLQQRAIPWSSVLASLSQAMPAAAIIDQVAISRTGAISMRGVAATRDDVLTLRDNLRALPFIKDVSNPLSNLLQRTDVRFEFEMTYAPPPPPTSETAPATNTQ
jgi:Tfp pilus assembly protein PilN